MLGATRETELRVRIATMQALQQRLQTLEKEMQELRKECNQVLEQLMWEAGDRLAEQARF